MSRLLYDSTNAADIPLVAPMVAGYVDGLYAWSEADWARFPRAVKVPIAVFASTDAGLVGDVESGDMSPQSAVGWVRMRRRAGVDPTVYMSWNAWAAVQAAFAAAGEPQPHYWVALYDGVVGIPAGAVAKQYINPPGSGGHYDLSLVADFWPGVDALYGPGGGSIGEQMTDGQYYQLLSVKYGLQLNPDGSIAKDGAGNPIPIPLLKSILDALGQPHTADPGALAQLAADLAEVKARVDKDLA